jgi:hypothetical protein
MQLLLTSGNIDDDQYASFLDICKTYPNGATPLCRHIAEVTQDILNNAPYLNERGQFASVIIATDGEASDGDIYAALQSLIDLPVMVVIRLCTNESKVVDYWNNIEKNLEIRLDVIDDLTGEAKEVKKVNSWITYGEPLQRMREFGVTMKELDILDEETLSWESFLRVTALIYGPEFVAGLPQIEVDWDQFFDEFQGNLNSYHTANMKEIFCPLRKEMEPWILLWEAQSLYAPAFASSKLSSSYKRKFGLILYKFRKYYLRSALFFMLILFGCWGYATIAFGSRACEKSTVCCLDNGIAAG